MQISPSPPSLRVEIDPVRKTQVFRKKHPMGAFCVVFSRFSCLFACKQAFFTRFLKNSFLMQKKMPILSCAVSIFAFLL